jgi:uncharacterized membrane protein YeaQ/YmgE (transglycosylase-associated protein family)
MQKLESQAPEIIYDSAPSEIDDEQWLAHGAKLVDDSIPSVRGVASELIKAQGMLTTVYLGILGFARFIPESLDIFKKALFVVPIIPWVIGIYLCLKVMKTELLQINLRSPTDIREKTTTLLADKQQSVDLAFGLLIAGLILAFVMVVFRLQN